MSDRIRYTLNSGVADVRFTRGERHNALDAEQMRVVYDIGAELAARKDVRAVVLSGEGPSFCSGLDFPSFQQPGQSLASAFETDDSQIANRAQRVATVWRDIPVPVIAALHGVAFGGGFQIAMGADLRIAAPDTRLCIMEIDYGLIPDMGISQTLPPVLPYDVALELTLSGRQIDADEALKLGLVTRIAEDAHAAAIALAEQFAARSPDAVRGTKALYQKSWLNQAELLRLEADLQQAIIARPNFAEAVGAKLQKRDASFRDVD